MGAGRGPETVWAVAGIAVSAPRFFVRSELSSNIVISYDESGRDPFEIPVTAYESAWGPLLKRAPGYSSYASETR